MLEKLIKLVKVDKFMDSIEYWFNELEDTGVYSLSSGLDTLVYKNDSYFDYINNLNSTDNIHLLVIKLFLNNRDIMFEYYRNNSNTVAEKFVRGSPYAVIELFKLCSRLFEFPRSVECNVIRNLTLYDSDYEFDNNTRLLMSTVKISSLDFMSKSDLQKFWNHMNGLYIERGSCTHEALCGSWKAGYDEDLVSRHILQEFGEEIPDESINGTVRELCRTCSLICGSSTNAYSDWHLEVYTSDSDPLVEEIYSVCLLISVVFLLLTLLVFFLIPHLRRLVHGKCTVFHLISMVTAYTCLTLPQLIRDFPISAPFLCYMNGHIMQFGFLAMFFWLNVMCFDILLAFCFLRNRKSCLRNERRETIKLVWYCCYGWGGPTIILILTFFMEYSDILDPENYLKPVIGGPKCFFQNLETQWLFLYGPIGCLILANLVMFTITALTIFRHSRSSDVLQTSDNSVSTRNDNSRLKVYINLFILMGANWATEALGWALPRNDWVFYVTDVTTTLQGLLVFVLFVCKPRVIRELRTKFGCPQRPNENEGVRFKTSFSSNKSTGQTQLTQSLDEK